MRGRELEPIGTLRTRRSGVRVVEEGEPVADVVVDRVSVMDGRRVAERFEELEVEAHDGDREPVERIARLLSDAGAVPTDGRPKIFRSLRLPPRERPAFTEEAEHVRAALEAQYERLLAHDPGTRLGVDAEELHKFRVATRRLRAILRAAGPLVDADWAAPLTAELRWLGGALGPARDLDVLLEHLEAERAALEGDEHAAAGELLGGLVGERASARARLLEALASDRYLALLDLLEGAARAPRLVAGEVTLAELAAREFAKLGKAARRVGPDSPDAELHALRIRGKRARYAAELAEPLAGKRASVFVERAQEFQDLIGDHQDAFVAEERIRALVAGTDDPRLAFAAGRIVERQRARRRAARESLPAAWQRLEKSGRRAWA